MRLDAIHFKAGEPLAKATSWDEPTKSLLRYFLVLGVNVSVEVTVDEAALRALARRSLFNKGGRAKAGPVRVRRTGKAGPVPMHHVMEEA